MSKHAFVKKIVLEVNGKELSLSVEDARGLLTALKEMLGDKEIRVVGQPYPVYPYQPYTPWVTYCTGSSNGIATSQTTTCSSPTAYLSS